MSAPDIRVELLLESNGPFINNGNFFTLDESELDGTDVLHTGFDWLDITENVMSLTIDRGRAKDIDAFQAGRASIRFLNNDRTFDPLNKESPLFGNTIPMRKIRIFAIVDEAETQIYQGFVEDWQVEYPDNGIWSTTTAVCSDAFSILAMQELDEISDSFGGDTAGQRIERVLDLAEVDFDADARDIQNTGAILGNTTFGENALSYLQTVEKSDSGSFFIAKNGDITFRERNSITESTNIVFSDTPSEDDSISYDSGFTYDSGETYDEGDDIPYQNIEVDFSTELLFNRVIVAGTTGNEQVSIDESSQESFQIRTLRRTSLFIQDDEFAQRLADWFIGRFSEPDFRFKSVQLNISDLSETKQRRLLNLEVNNLVVIEKTPPGDGEPEMLEQFAIIDGLSWKWQPGNNFNVTVRISSGEKLVAFILDDPGLGVLDQNRLGL